MFLFLLFRLLLRLSTKDFAESLAGPMTDKFGCVSEDTGRLLEVAKQLDLNVVGVRYGNSKCSLLINVTLKVELCAVLHTLKLETNTKASLILFDKTFTPKFWVLVTVFVFCNCFSLT